MKDTLSLLHPYNIILDGNMSYTFTTDEGVVYHAYFMEFSNVLTGFQSVYTFNIESESNEPHPIDIRISHTIVSILELFFRNIENAIIFVCDNIDGKERKRNIKFDRWYQNWRTENIEKYDATADTEDYVLYVSLLINVANPKRKEIVSAFYKLVSNNMIPL